MKKNNKKGFTLVELVIVVAVMAVLVAVAIPTVQSIVGTAESNVAATNAQTIESMLKLAVANGKTLSDDDDIAQEIVDAQLGIEKAATFVYNTKSGAVKVGKTPGTDEKLITFSATGVKVGAMSTEILFTAVSAAPTTP